MYPGEGSDRLVYEQDSLASAGLCGPYSRYNLDTLVFLHFAIILGRHAAEMACQLCSMVEDKVADQHSRGLSSGQYKERLFDCYAIGLTSGPYIDRGHHHV